MPHNYQGFHAELRGALVWLAQRSWRCRPLPDSASTNAYLGHIKSLLFNMKSRSLIPSSSSKMNSTGSSLPDNDILCPLDNRRSSREVYLRFFVINFATLSFYLHFVRRRDGTYLAGNPSLFVLAPLNLVFRYTLGVLGILGVFILYILINFPRQSHLDSVSRDTFLMTPLSWLFGKARIHDYSALPASESEEDEPSRPPSGYIGRLVVNGVFITQCVGSIFIYIRRRRHFAVTQLDEKVFGAALGGLVIGVLNICRSLSLPMFDEYVPSDHTAEDSDNKTALDRFALFCRDSCRKPLLAFNEFNEEYSHLLRFFKNLAITVLILLMTSDSGFFEGMHNLWAKLIERYNEDPAYVCTSLGFVAFFSAVFGSIGPCIFYNEGKRTGQPNILNRYPFLLVILSPISGAVMIVFCAIGVIVISAGAYALTISWSFSYLIAFNEAANLTTTPTNVSCPLLWSDPVAAWVWGLA